MHFRIVVDVDRDLSAVRETTKEELVGEGAAYRVLDEPRHWARTHQRIEAGLREVLLERLRERDLHFLLVQLIFELHEELVDHSQDDLAVERRERNDGVEPVPEL